MSVTRLGGGVLGVLVFAAALALWDAWPRSEWAAFYFPGVGTVAHTAREVWLDGDFLRAVGASLRRLALGYALGALTGIAIGVAIGSSPRARSTLGPTTEFLRAVPVVAVLPIAIVLLGDGDAMRVAVIAFGVFFPVSSPPSAASARCRGRSATPQRCSVSATSSGACASTCRPRSRRSSPASARRSRSGSS